MRSWPDRPSTVTHRSRGNDKTATSDVAGLIRHIMIVSLRSPMFERSPNAGAYNEPGSTQELLSAPVIRKFLAPGSAGGKVGGVVVSAASSTSLPSPTVVGGAIVAVVLVAGLMIVDAMLRSSTTRWPAYKSPAAPKQAVAQRNAPVIVNRCGQVRRGLRRGV